MKQFRVYKNLTVGYNFAILLATAIMILSLSIDAKAQGAVIGDGLISSAPDSTPTGEAAQQNPAPTNDTTAAAQPMQIVAAPVKTAADIKREECTKSQDALNSRLDKLKVACASTKIKGDCIQKLFQCQNGNGSDETCKQVNDYNSADTQSEIDHKITKLKKERDSAEKIKEKIEDQIDKIKSESEELTGEQSDLQNEKSLATEELQEQLKNNKSAAAKRSEELQNGIDALQQKIREIHASSLDDANALTNLIATSRIQCLNEGRERAEKFVEKVRTCTKNGGQCGVSQNTIFRLGKKSLQDLGNSYQSNHVKKCMALNGNTNFGVQYMALQSQIDRKTQYLNQQRAELVAKQNQLQIQIQLIPKQNSINDTQSMLEKAQKDQALTQKEQDLMMKQMQKNIQIVELKKKAEAQQQKLDKAEDMILEQEKKKASALNDDSLRRFKEALADISYIKNEATSSYGNCGCTTGALKTISQYSDNGACGTETPYTDNSGYSATTE